MSQEIERRRGGGVARRSRRADRPPEVGPDPDKAALRLPDGVELPTAADRELVALLVQAGSSLDLMCRTRLYRGMCQHCESADPCEAETLVFRFMRGLADTIRASSEVMDLLVLLSTDGVADLDAVVHPPEGELPEPAEITSRPET